MLPERITEAETNVRSYLNDGLLRKTRFDPNIFAIFKRNAYESLKVAVFLEQNKKSSLWVIVTSYYAMFYLANALLYSLGYKVGERIAHKVTADALIVFARERIKQSLLDNYNTLKDEALATMKATELVAALDHERKKRNFIQYDTPEEIKEAKVQTSLARAKEFLLQLNKLLEH